MHIDCLVEIILDIQNSNDDGEHGTTRFVLNAMKRPKIQYRAIFITREYEGEQIGMKRFEAYLKAARFAILHHPHLIKHNIVDVPWPEEYCRMEEEEVKNGKKDPESTTNNISTRGRGRGRGRRGQNRHRWQQQGNWGGDGWKHGLPIHWPRGARGRLQHIDELRGSRSTQHMEEDDANLHSWARASNMEGQQFDEDGFPIVGPVGENSAVEEGS